MPTFADDLARLRAAMREGVLAPKADVILTLARPCLRIVRDAAQDAGILVGASKFGGAPDVPDGFVWPEYDRFRTTFFTTSSGRPTVRSRNGKDRKGRRGGRRRGRGN